jgi:hypothetical protein
MEGAANTAALANQAAHDTNARIRLVEHLDAMRPDSSDRKEAKKEFCGHRNGPENKPERGTAPDWCSVWSQLFHTRKRHPCWSPVATGRWLCAITILLNQPLRENARHSAGTHSRYKAVRKYV